MPQGLDAGELAELLAVGVLDPAFLLGGGDVETREPHASAVVAHRGRRPLGEAGRNRLLRREGEDQRSLRLGGSSEGVQPERLPQPDELRRAELEDLEEQVDHEMVVEDGDPGQLGELPGDGELSRRDGAVQEDEVHPGTVVGAGVSAEGDFHAQPAAFPSQPTAVRR